MNILFVTTKMNFDRAGGSVVDLDCKIRELQRQGANVRVLTVFSELNQHLLSVPYTIVEEHVQNKSLFPMQWSIFRFLRLHAKDADVLHIEGQFAYAAGLYRFCGGKPVVAFYNREMQLWTWRNGGVRERVKRILRRFIERALYVFLVSRIDQFIFTTPQLAACYRRFGLVATSRRLTIMPDFIDHQKMRMYIGPKKKAGVVRVFTSGRMIPEKGFNLLIDALAFLPIEVRRKISVTVSGDGPERQNLIREARTKELEKLIQFPGWLPKDEMHSQLATADVFIYPRFHQELSSVLLMEALACGVPVVVPAGGGLEWVAGNGAETFQDNDAPSLAAAIEKLVESRDRRDALRRGASSRAEEFDNQKMGEHLMRILKAAARL